MCAGIQVLACLGRGGGEDNLVRNLLGEVEFLLRNVMEEGRGSKNGQNCVT